MSGWPAAAGVSRLRCCRSCAAGLALQSICQSSFLRAPQSVLPVAPAFLLPSREAAPVVRTAEGPADWRVPWDDWLSTRYEQKALREGRTPHYLTFRRQ